MSACDWFWSTSELPQARLHELVDMPFVLRLTCTAMRDAHHKGAEVEKPRRQPKTIVYWTLPHSCKTKSWVMDLVTSVSRTAWAIDAKLIKTCALVRAAAAVGALPSLKWLLEHTNYWFANDYDSCHSAAKYGHLDTLRWLVRTARARWTPNDIVDVAAKNGHLDCLKWAMRNGCETPRHILPEVARNGHTDVVEFLWIYNASERVTEAVAEAARQGHVDMLRMFRRHGLDMGHLPREEAASCGQLEALKFLIDDGRTDFDVVEEVPNDDGWLDKCVVQAIKNGHLQVLDWLVHTFPAQCDIGRHECEVAASRGHVHVLAWLLKRGFKDALLDERVRQCAEWFRQEYALWWLNVLKRNEGFFESDASVV